MIDNSKEYILCAAIKRKIPRKDNCGYHKGTNDISDIEIGYRHHDIYQRFNNRDEHPDIEDCPISFKQDDQGFYTSKGRFVDRYEGMEVAYLAGQVSEKVALSKDWYNHGQLNLNGEVTTPEYWESIDKHKYNMLFSEDLY